MTHFYFHGTRVKENIIKKEGLKPVTKDVYLKWIKEALSSVGLSYAEWLKKRLIDKRYGRLNVLSDIEEKSAFHNLTYSVYVSDNPTTAWMYASHGSEIICRAIKEAYIDKHPKKGFANRETENHFKEKAMSKVFGAPIVVVIDASKIATKEVRTGLNIAVKGNIPPSAIVHISRYPKEKSFQYLKEWCFI